LPQADRAGLVFASARSYVCVEPNSGKEIWRQRWLTTFGCNAADAIVSGNHVFLSSGYNRGSALLSVTADAPELLWKHKDFQNQLVSSVLVDGYLFGASGDVASGAELVCVELMTGDVRWRSDAVRVGALSVAGDRLIVLSDSGELVIAQTSPERFEILARHQVLEGKCWTAPVLSNGRIYCRTASGQIVCIDVRK
jgi:outer membrane protein assembly factor BamB